MPGEENDLKDNSNMFPWKDVQIYKCAFFQC